MAEKPIVKWLETLKETLGKLAAPIVRMSKRIVLPGFDGVPLYDVSSFFFTGIMKNSINLRASAISFDFVMAMAPAVLFFFTLIPSLPIPDLHNTIMETIHSALPENAFLTVQSTIEDIISRSNRGLLSLGFLLSLYFASNGMISVMKAFNQSVLVTETRSNLKIRLVAILLVIILTFILILSAGLQIISHWAIERISHHLIIAPLLFKIMFLMVKYLFFIAMLFSAYSFIYYLAPAYHGMYRFISPGSTLATIATIVTIEVFSYFINNFGHYNTLYGSLGTLIVILLLININALILLIGFELNASIYSAKTSESNGKASINADKN